MGIKFLGSLVGFGPDCTFCKGKGRFDSFGEWWYAQLTNLPWNLLAVGISIGLLALWLFSNQ
jgi:hypothetical protein